MISKFQNRFLKDYYLFNQCNIYGKVVQRV